MCVCMVALNDMQMRVHILVLMLSICVHKIYIRKDIRIFSICKNKMNEHFYLVAK